MITFESRRASEGAAPMHLLQSRSLQESILCGQGASRAPVVRHFLRLQSLRGSSFDAFSAVTERSGEQLRCIFLRSWILRRSSFDALFAVAEHFGEQLQCRCCGRRAFGGAASTHFLRVAEPPGEKLWCIFVVAEPPWKFCDTFFVVAEPLREQLRCIFCSCGGSGGSMPFLWSRGFQGFESFSHLRCFCGSSFDTFLCLRSLQKSSVDQIPAVAEPLAEQPGCIFCGSGDSR